MADTRVHVNDEEAQEDYSEVGTCCLCGGTFSHHGNNALPLVDGGCCDRCNSEKVVPQRKPIVARYEHGQLSEAEVRKNAW